MIRTLNVAERGIYANGANPVTVPANTSTNAIPDQTVQPKMEEIAYRYIQNISGSNMFYAFGQEATSNNYHGVLPSYGQLDCSNHRLRVSVFSAAGAVVAVTILYRNDQGRNNAAA
jgi:hypothetical protein